MITDEFRTAFKERFGAALTADAAYRVGAKVGVPGSNILPLEPGLRIAGPARTVEANNDLVAILVALHRAESGSVLVIGNAVGGVAGLTGDIIATEARRIGVEAIVVDGHVRDTQEIRRIGQAVYCRGRVVVGPLKLAPGEKGIGVPGATVVFGDSTVSDGQWIVGDDDGLLVLEESDLKAIMEEAERSLQKEATLISQIKSGASLGDAFGIEEYFEKRRSDPEADFNAHIASRGKAI